MSFRHALADWRTCRGRRRWRTLTLIAMHSRRHRRRINIAMKESSTSLNDDMPERRWIVCFEGFRTRDEAQHRAICVLRETAFEVVKIWLKVVTPGAVAVGPTDHSVWRIAFPCRSQMRQFMQAFGGRQLRPSQDGTRPYPR
jgi:hypothetical protein